MVKYLNKSNIEWTDFTWNPEVGCRNRCSKTWCYAAALCKRFAKPWGRDPEDPFKPTFYPERLDAPSKLAKPSKIFVCSMGELWGPWVPVEWQNSVVSAMRTASWHTFLNLTKNPQGLLDYQKSGHQYPPNLWLGVSVTGDDDESRLHDLAKVDHPNKFVSFEPLLADVVDNGWFTLEGIKWAIIGCQTGPGAKPYHEVARAMSKIIGACSTEENWIPIFVKDNVLQQTTWLNPPREYPEGL